MPRRRYSRRYRRRNKKRSVKKISGNPFPNRIVRKLRTTQYYDLGASTTGAIKTTRIWLNNLYDPETTHGTQQPLGYDQYASLYERYCVIGFKVSLEFHNKDDQSWVVGAHLADFSDSVTLSSYEHYAEIKNTKYRLLSPDMDKQFFVFKGSPPKMLYDKNPLSMASRTSAQFASNPTDACYLHIFAQPADQTSTTGDGCEVIVKLEQITVFYDYIKPTRSAV